MARKSGSHAEITGPLVRDAALRLFAKGGYAAVSMRQIAADVGVQVGALYLYTPDKQTLLFDLIHAHMNEMLVAWHDSPKGVTAQERLQAFSQFHLRFHLDRPDAVAIAHMELRNLTPENHALITGLQQEYEASLENILADGHKGEEFRVPDVKLAAMAIIAMLTGVNSWYRENERLTRERVERIYWNMVRRAVGA